VESYPYDNEEEMSEDEENDDIPWKVNDIRGAGDLEYDRCSPTEFYIRLM
jgi:hypothetical protein